MLPLRILFSNIDVAFISCLRLIQKRIDNESQGLPVDESSLKKSTFFVTHWTSKQSTLFALFLTQEIFDDEKITIIDYFSGFSRIYI